MAGHHFLKNNFIKNRKSFYILFSLIFFCILTKYFFLDLFFSIDLNKDLIFKPIFIAPELDLNETFFSLISITNYSALISLVHHYFNSFYYEVINFSYLFIFLFIMLILIPFYTHNESHKIFVVSFYKSCQVLMLAGYDFICFFYSICKCFIVKRMTNLDSLVFCGFYKGGFTFYDLRISMLNSFLSFIAGTPFFNSLSFLYKSIQGFLDKYIHDIVFIFLILFFSFLGLRYKLVDCLTAFNADLFSLSLSLQEVHKELTLTCDVLSQGNSVPHKEIPVFSHANKDTGAHFWSYISDYLHKLSLYFKDFKSSDVLGLIFFVLFIAISILYVEAKFSNYIGNVVRGPDDPEDDAEDDNVPEDVALEIVRRGVEQAALFEADDNGEDGKYGLPLWGQFIQYLTNGNNLTYTYFQFFLMSFAFKSLLPFFELFERVEGRRSVNTVTVFFLALKSVIEGSPYDYYISHPYKVHTYIYELQKQSLILIDSIYRSVILNLKPSLASTLVSPTDELLKKITSLQERILEFSNEHLVGLVYSEHLSVLIREERVLFSELLFNLKVLTNNCNKVVTPADINNLNSIVQSMDQNLTFLFSKVTHASTLNRGLSFSPDISESTFGLDFLHSTTGGELYIRIIENLSPEWHRFVNDGFIFVYSYVPRFHFLAGDISTVPVICSSFLGLFFLIFYSHINYISFRKNHTVGASFPGSINPFNNENDCEETELADDY